MELDEALPTNVAGRDEMRDQLGDPRLAGARRPRKYDLWLVRLQDVNDFLQPLFWPEGLLGEPRKCQRARLGGP
jgi:hypothetical protein